MRMLNRGLFERRAILRLAIAFAILHSPFAIADAALTAASASVTDGAGAARPSYSSTERITLSINVQNTQAAAGNIQFSFEIKDPAGARRFFQTGNSAPGSMLGRTGATLRGIPVTQFYTTPGLYTLTGTATLGAERVTASVQFTILSPVITLTYPPNGARDIVDQPLTFRWVSSGATRYRIYVDDDSSFYNSLLTAETISGFFAYPQNPPDQRQRLANGQIYYWKVEGLDASGNVVARTDVPFTFTVKVQGQSTSKDLAIVDVAKVNEAIPGGQGALPIAVFVKNQGGRPEVNVPVNVFADGAVVPSSPKRIAQIDAGKTERLVFPVRPPEAGKSVLVNAFLDIFDDNLQNNTMSRQFQAERPVETCNGESIWAVLRSQAANYLPEVPPLEGYSIDFSAEEMSRGDICALVRAVAAGKARVTGAKVLK